MVKLHQNDFFFPCETVFSFTYPQCFSSHWQRLFRFCICRLLYEAQFGHPVDYQPSFAEDSCSMKVLITLLTENPSGKQFAEKQIDEISAYGTFQYCAQQEADEASDT